MMPRSIKAPWFRVIGTIPIVPFVVLSQVSYLICHHETYIETLWQKPNVYTNACFKKGHRTKRKKNMFVKIDKKKYVWSRKKLYGECIIVVSKLMFVKSRVGKLKV